MALTIGQIVAASYNTVLTKSRKAADQWSENAALREMEKAGIVEQVAGGAQIEETLDYRRNPGGEFLSGDMATLSANKTEVLTSAIYDWAELAVPIVWSRGDEAKNASENQKVAFVKTITTNSLNTHDDLVEQALFSVTTEAFHGLQTVVPDAGQGTVGGIDASTETFWRNPVTTYASNFSDIEAKLETEWNAVVRGTGSTKTPKIIISNAATQAGYMGTQQDNIRYIDIGEANAGFKVAAYKTARWIFSPYGSTRIYMLSPAAVSLKVVKGAFRDLGPEVPIPHQNATERKIYSMLQLTTREKARCGLLTVA
jgi:hypothetical protein